jgi:hypothetical protein
MSRLDSNRMNDVNKQVRCWTDFVEKKIFTFSLFQNRMKVFVEK